MNVYIPFISSSLTNKISCLETTNLSAYILTPEEQQYIKNLSNDTASVISNQLLIASIKAGSSLYTQPELNKIYARHDSSYSESDKENFKNFMNTKMVGNAQIEFSEIEGDE